MIVVRILIITALGLPLAQAETRSFTNSDGRAIEAELVGFADGKAMLKLANGKTAPVPITSLSPADQEYIDLWASDPSRSTVTADVTMEQYLTNLGCDSIPYNDEKSAMVIKLMIADREHTFVINTNLPYSYLDGPIADVLGLTVKQTGDVLSTFDGRQLGVGEGKLENFQLGSSKFESRIFRVANLVATGINNFGIQVDGILGYDFLQEYGAVLDYKAKKLYFLPPPPPAEE
ncbi:MAG: SHD1 domain-containing protein [Verrucomicrobiota bacterium]